MEIGSPLVHTLGVCLWPRGRLSPYLNVISSSRMPTTSTGGFSLPYPRSAKKITLISSLNEARQMDMEDFVLVATV